MVQKSARTSYFGKGNTTWDITRYSAAMRPLLVLLTAIVLLSGCAGTATEVSPSPSAIPSVQEFNQELHDELLAMFDRDQASRMGEPVDESDQERTDRLKEIVDEFGWPTISLVGEDGEDAAWTITQHSDLDPAFQELALELLAVAVEAGEASPGNLAYLTDRVAVGKGEPQVYGTQGGCNENGEPVIGPVVDEENLDARRAEVGLPPMADYLAEFAAACAQG